MSQLTATADTPLYLHRRYRLALGPANAALYDLETARIHRLVGPMRTWVAQLVDSGRLPTDMPVPVQAWLLGSGYLTDDAAQAAAQPHLKAVAASQRKMVWIELTEQLSLRVAPYSCAIRW